MNAYIEKESLRSLISQRNDARYEECLRMLKRNLKLNFSFSKADAHADPAIRTWLVGLTTGALAPRPEYDSTFPNPDVQLSLKDISSDCDKTVERLCAIYLLDDKEPQRMATAMLVSYCGNELDTLSKLYVKEESQEYEDEPSAASIGSWRVLSAYSTPCTDILISDRYLLSHRSLLSRNLRTIINTLVQKTHNLSVNIVIMVEQNSIDPDIDLDDLSEIIKRDVEDVVGKEPNVTFVLCRQHRTPLFHDRLILTNYRAITSGDSFNYFNERGEVKTGGFGIMVSSLAKRSNYVKEKVIETYCCQLERDVAGAIVQGDKKSNFLKQFR